jgi:hypothetical protein
MLKLNNNKSLLLQKALLRHSIDNLWSMKLIVRQQRKKIFMLSGDM